MALPAVACGTLSSSPIAVAVTVGFPAPRRRNSKRLSNSSIAVRSNVSSEGLHRGPSKDVSLKRRNRLSLLVLVCWVRSSRPRDEREPCRRHSATACFRVVGKHVVAAPRLEVSRPPLSRIRIQPSKALVPGRKIPPQWRGYPLREDVTDFSSLPPRGQRLLCDSQ